MESETIRRLLDITARYFGLDAAGPEALNEDAATHAAAGEGVGSMAEAAA